ncbi:S-(hydroxymethyl)mycothiol dehydrogenase [Nocardia brasiliensis]|uniref:S-(Hydroxymethyl)mycothiol dehydrogenase n=1 Tax=Nocardia brasiliensis TaxID=37326 RepID=A0A6G9XR15_NOCBR|nr:S-(hydroxymethyl)mycothiol dehydrogenase [Nocardia brasiliensis]QIS03357.1 S-(hydroxymethyl)mycothiol dehydrogenase [Nocardia brasiliensis]
MAQTVVGVVAKSAGAPVELAEIVVPDPGPGEVVVRVQACGVCHTDANHRDGIVGADFPYLLGHEAAGTVESVGPGVTDLAPGDFVILNWRAVCGGCRACRKGKLWNCSTPLTAGTPSTLADGTPLTSVLGLGALAEKALVHARQCTRVEPDIAPAAAAVIGCGIATGVGAALWTGAVERGDTVAIIGCAGIGSAAVAGAGIAGAEKIIAVDSDQRRLDWARQFGATHFVDTRTTEPVARIRELTDGYGADVVIDAVGRLETWKQAFYSRAVAGTVVQLGVPTPDVVLDIPLFDLRVGGGSLKSSWYGDCLPSRDFPFLVGLYRQGRLDLDAYVTETVTLDRVEEAFRKLRDEQVLRSVVLL